MFVLAFIWSPAFALPPTVFITSPANGSNVDSGVPITFRAVVFDDVDDSAVLTAAVAWSSNIDGSLGTGGTIIVNDLAVGGHVITAAVTDSDSEQGSRSISITINNRAPTANAQSVSTTEDTPVAITLTGSDPEGDPLTYAIATGPANGVLSGTPPNVTYTPNANYNGADSFTFTVSDGELTSAAATVSIAIGADNDVPTAEPQSVSTPEDTPLAITLTGADLEGDPLTFAIATDPANGVLSGTPPNVTYTPNANYNGADSFTFTVNDGELTSAAAAVSVTVDADNDNPALAAPIDDQFAIEGTPFTLDIAGNFTDVDGDPLQLTVSGLPPSGNLAFNEATGVIEGIPEFEDARDNDPYLVIVAATDGVPDTVPVQDTFELSISALDRANVTLDITVTPDPAMLNDELRWTFTVSNLNGPQAVQNTELEGSFVGAGLAVTSGDQCVVDATGMDTTDFACSLADLPVGATTSIVLTSATGAAGDVVVFATARSSDPIPIDPVLEDNSVQVAVGVAEAFSNGVVQVLGTASVRSIAAGDVDGDGAADLVVGTDTGQPVQIYLSDGFRSFLTPGVPLADSAANEGVALADFDGNGTLDLVVANGSGLQDNVYGNDGAGNFAPMAGLGTTFSHGVAVGDFNGDGNADIVFAAVNGNPVYLGDGLGGFTLETTLGDANSHGVAVGKLDGDNLDDIVFANVGSDSETWLRDPGGGFSLGEALSIGDAVAVAIGDLGGDSTPDLAFARVPGANGDIPANPVLINDGSGAFDGSTLALGTAPSSDIHVGDVNRDGLNDLVFVNLSGVHQIWTAAAGGFELYREQIVDGDSVVGVLAELGMADMGDSGGVDLAMGGAVAAGIGVYLNDGFGNLGRGDATPPVLALNGETSVAVPAGSNYVDAGATAQDNIDGDISASVQVDNPVNTALVGDYVVTYTVVDAAGNAATPISRTVTVTPSAGSGGGGGGAVSWLLLFLLGFAAMTLAGHVRTLSGEKHRWSRNQ